MGNHAQQKLKARRAVHKAFGVSVSYTSAKNVPPGPQALTARLHNKLTVDKAVMGGGYATTIDADTRVIFLVADLQALGIVLDKGDRVRFAEFNVTVILNTKATTGVGPLLEKWTVTQR